MTELCKPPQRRIIIMPVRSPVSRASIRGQEPLDETAVAQPGKGPVDLVDGNVVHRQQPPLADPLRHVTGTRVVAPVPCEQSDNLFRRSIEHDRVAARFCLMVYAN